MELSPSVLDVISRMRRRISDTDSPPVFSDELLYGYVRDAVDELESGAYSKGVSVDDGDFSRPVNNSDLVIYSIQATIIFIQGIKAKADRDNFSLRKQNLTVDTSKQSSDHAETLNILMRELDKRIKKAIMSGAIPGASSGAHGYRIE